MSKVQGAFAFLESSALDGMGVDHRRPNVTVSQQFLNRSYVVIGLKQVTGKAMTKGMGAHTFVDLRLLLSRPKRLSYMRFMEMVPSILPGIGVSNRWL